MAMSRFMGGEYGKSRCWFLAAVHDRGIEPLIGFRIRNSWKHGKFGQRVELSRRVFEFGIWQYFLAIVVVYPLVTKGILPCDPEMPVLMVEEGRLIGSCW